MSAADKSQQNLARMVAKAFGTPEGKETLKLMTRLFYTPSSYVKGDTHDSAYREGKKEVIRWIRTKLAIAKADTPEEEE